MNLVRLSAAAIASGTLACVLSAAGPAPASADPIYGRDGGVMPVQYYRYEDDVRAAPRGTYGRRAYVEDLFEDDDPRYYRAQPRRIPSARERSGADYSYESPRAYGRGEARVRRYYDEDYSYESPPSVERGQRSRLAGPPSALGAGEGRRAMDPKFARATVPYKGPEPANSIVINTSTRYLYLVQGDGTAIRYGVGVGKEGFTWKGVQKISAKREWPDWHPPAEMRQRRPELPVMMVGGPDNPLGARALYLGNTLYRIHGSNEPWSIGRAVSSGCIRMTNDDVTDLYERVGVGTTVKVL